MFSSMGKAAKSSFFEEASLYQIIMVHSDAGSRRVTTGSSRIF
jgi:hypothetical protein